MAPFEKSWSPVLVNRSSRQPIERLDSKAPESPRREIPNSKQKQKEERDRLDHDLDDIKQARQAEIAAQPAVHPNRLLSGAAPTQYEEETRQDYGREFDISVELERWR